MLSLDARSVAVLVVSIAFLTRLADWQTGKLDRSVSPVPSVPMQPGLAQAPQSLAANVAGGNVKDTVSRWL